MSHFRILLVQVVATNRGGDGGALESPESPKGLRSTENLNLDEVLILDMSCHISLQDSLLTFMNRLRPLLIQFFLEVDEHLEKLTSNEEPCHGLVGLLLERGSTGKVLFADILCERLVS